MNYTILEDRIDPQTWKRHMRLMAGKADDLKEFEIPAHATLKRYVDDIRMHHLDASWALRQVIRMQHPDHAEALWTITPWWVGEQRLSQAMLDAGVAFALATGQDPQTAMVRRMPAGVEEFTEYKGMTLGLADWVLDGFVVVTAAGMWCGLPVVDKQHVVA